MIRFGSLSIYHKVLAVALTAVLLLGVLSAVVIGDSLGDVMGQQLERRAIEIGTHVASLSINHILVDDRYSLHELIHETKMMTEDVRYILITDHEGRVLAHTFPHGIPLGLRGANRPPAKAEIRVMQLDSNEGLIRDVLVPIEGGAVGYVRIGITQELTKAIIAKTLQKFAFIIACVCLLAILLAARMARLITAPISTLAQVAKAIAKGYLASKVNITTQDEVGELATAFNEMASSIAATNQEREVLVEALREKEQLRATLFSKLITAQEDERRRISRELHDEAGQSLTSLIVSMRALADKASDERQREILMGARDVAADTLHGIRNMAVELRPPVLDDLGLVAAMKKYIATYQERFDVTVKLNAEEMQPCINKQTAVALYRIMQESLTNITKHSQATAVDITIKQRAGDIVMQIADNGRGITEAELEQAIKENRLGIYGMKERAELLNGVFALDLSMQKGTAITVTIPSVSEGEHFNGN